MKLAGQLGESKPMVKNRQKKAYDENRRKKRKNAAVRHLKNLKKKFNQRAPAAINRNPTNNRKRMVGSAKAAVKRRR